MNVEIDLSRFSCSVIKNETELDEILTQPTPAVCKAICDLEGDLLILGVGGKMGPTLARLAKRAVNETEI